MVKTWAEKEVPQPGQVSGTPGLILYSHSNLSLMVW